MIARRSVESLPPLLRGDARIAGHSRRDGGLNTARGIPRPLATERERPVASYGNRLSHRADASAWNLPIALHTPSRSPAPSGASRACCAPGRSGPSGLSDRLATSRQTRPASRPSPHRHGIARIGLLGFQDDGAAHVVATAGGEQRAPNRRADARWSGVSWFDAIMANVSGGSSRFPSTMPRPTNALAKVRLSIGAEWLRQLGDERDLPMPWR